MNYEESPYHRNDKKRVIGGKYKWRISGVKLITLFFFFFRNTIFDLNNQYWKIHLINPQQKLINRLLY